MDGDWLVLLIAITATMIIGLVMCCLTYLMEIAEKRSKKFRKFTKKIERKFGI